VLLVCHSISQWSSFVTLFPNGLTLSLNFPMVLLCHSISQRSLSVTQFPNGLTLSLHFPMVFVCHCISQWSYLVTPFPNGLSLSLYFPVASNMGGVLLALFPPLTSNFTNIGSLFSTVTTFLHIALARRGSTVCYQIQKSPSACWKRFAIVIIAGGMDDGTSVTGSSLWLQYLHAG
jgi:hypothetical protein